MLRVPKATWELTLPAADRGQQEQLNAASVAQVSTEPAAKRARVEAVAESSSSELQRHAARPNAAELRARLLALRDKAAEVSHLRDQTAHHEQLQAASLDSESLNAGGGEMPVQSQSQAQGNVRQQNGPAPKSGGVAATAMKPAPNDAMDGSSVEQIDEGDSDDDIDDGDLMASLQSAFAPPCSEQVAAKTQSSDQQESCSSAVLQQNLLARGVEEDVEEQVEEQVGEQVGEEEEEEEEEAVDQEEQVEQQEEEDVDESLGVANSGTDLGALLGEVFGMEARSKAIQRSEGQVSFSEAADSWASSLHGSGADEEPSTMLAVDPVDSPDVVESPELFDVAEEPVEMQSGGEVPGACVIDDVSDEDEEEEEEDEEDYDPFSTEPMPI